MSAQQQAYDFTKRQILDGTFAEDTLLSEGAVAESVGVSRTPVREAFLRLEAEGLLRLYPKRGALVVPVPPGEAEHVLDARLAIELFAADRVTGGADGVVDIVAEAMEDEITAQRRAGAGEDWPAFSEADRAFHRRLVAASGNPVLVVFYDSLRERQVRLTVRSLYRDERRGEQILREHEGLVTLLREGGGPRLHEALAAHFQGSLRALRHPGA